MKSLTKPSYKVASVFADCISIRRDSNLKSRLEGVKTAIDCAETQYEFSGDSKHLFLVQPTTGVGLDVTTDEMEGLYTEVFARKSSKMRSVYDAIKLASVNDVCPICAQRNVSTLDHYLPKAKHPSLAVTPLNLIPACFECNHIKDDYHPAKEENQLLHPYFDILADEIWLLAQIGETSPPSVTFAVEVPVGWDQILAMRLRFHFEKFGLAGLYSSQAGTTLAGITSKLASALARGGEAEVRFSLQEDADSWGKSSKNSWQAAFYRALASSSWFCSGGFQ